LAPAAVKEPSSATTQKIFKRRASSMEGPR
jgi:hypothetical protein